MKERSAAWSHLARAAAHALGAPMGVLAILGPSAVEVVSSGFTEPGRGPVAFEVAAVDGVILVRDLAADPRFAGGCWARMAPAARALALAPADGADGAHLAVLAVMDTRPRAWTQADAEALSDLAAVAGETLELGSIAAALAEEVARERRAGALFGSMMEHFPHGTVAMVDRDMRFTAAGGRLPKLTSAEVVGKTVREVFGEAQGAVIEASFREVFGGEDVVHELESAGRTFLVHRWPIRGEDGTIIAAMMLSQDITARVEMERALRESELRHRTLFERAPEPIAIVATTGARAGRFLDANAAALAAYGYTHEEVLALRVAEIVPAERQGILDERMRRAAAGEWVRGTNVNVRKDGTRFPVDISAGPLDVQGERCLLTFPRDMTDQVRAEEALREARDAAEAANRAKSTFLTNMSHEIRTPMHAILGYAQLLQRDPGLGEVQRGQLGIIQQAGDRLLALINDVLEMSKIEAGHRTVQRVDVDVAALLGEVLRMFQVKARAKGLSLAVRVDGSVPRSIVGDEGRLTQVLVNLIGNAVKFTARGEVTVRATCERGGTLLVVLVQDTGPGIEPEIVGALFQPFSQARAGIEAHGGTGLGLAISREHARAMGGDLTVTSRVGEGSVFRFVVPCSASLGPGVARGAPAQRVVAIAGGGVPLRVLIVDDDADNRGWLRLLLLQIGFDVREAENGAEALALVASWRPRLVLLDVNMPVMNGFEVMRAIRAMRSDERTAIVAVTASAFDDQRALILAAGADAVLRKPCREGDLLDEIGRQLDLTYLRAAAPAAAPAGASPPEGTISVELAAALLEAVDVADYEQIIELIGRLPAEHAAALRAMAERFAYDEIAARLRT